MTSATHAPTPAATEPLRAELEGLVRIAARRPQLTVRTGRPGCNWAFSWDTDEVTVDPEHLESLAPDLCRGLALHEAAHAAVTVLHRILAEAHLARIHPLLNVIEDIRIEIWMRSRFPGAAPWIRAYNDVFYGRDPTRPTPRSRQVQFLGGILELWWFGTAPGLLPEVASALEACRGAIAAASGCQPPLDDDPEAILSSQRAMWEIVRRRILPTWERLVALDRRDGIARLASQELQLFMERTGGGTCRPGRGSGRLRPRRRGAARTRRSVSRQAAVRAGRDTAHEGGHRGGPGASPVPATTTGDGDDLYRQAWRRIGAVADHLGNELLRMLVPCRRMRWSAGHPWGPRLDLRRAMQFEADPQLHDSLWRRPILPHRRDPAVLLLVDRSSSMKQEGRIDRALEGTVLLAEVCRRIGVAAAVWSFAGDVVEELDWEAAIDGPARWRIGLLPERCSGNTSMSVALRTVGQAFAGWHGDPKLLFVIGDGAPDDHDATVAAVRALESAGVATIGLGLGAGTANMARYFQTVVTEIDPERLVDHVAELLGEAILASA